MLLGARSRAYSAMALTQRSLLTGVFAANSAAPDSAGARPLLTTQVVFDPSATSADAFVAAVEDAGFDARLMEVIPSTRNGGGGGANGSSSQPNGGGGGGVHDVHSKFGSGSGARRAPQVARLAVGGMTCAACSGAVERALGGVAGVLRVGVALTEGEAEVRAVLVYACFGAVIDLRVLAQQLVRRLLAACARLDRPHSACLC